MTTAQPAPNKMLKHSTIYAIGNISRQLVGFIMLPVYTRYLTPADYGVIGLLAFAVTLLESALGARLTQAMPKFYYQQTSDQGKNSVVSTALIITSAVSLVTALVIYLMREPGASVLFGTNEFSLAIGLYGFQLLISAIEAYGLMYIRILQKPILFISFNLSKLVVQLTLNIWFVVHLEMGVMGVVYSSVSSAGLFAIFIAAYTIKHTGIRFDWPLGKQMLIFSWPLWLSGLAIFYAGASSRYYIRLFSSLSEVGLFELASKFTAILIMILWQPFSQYWETERFKIYNEGNQEAIYEKVFAGICTLMAIGTLGVSVFAAPVIHLMADQGFHAASKATPLLTIGATFSSLATFFNFSFLVKEKTFWISKNNFLIAALVTLLYLALTPIFGYLGAAAAICAAQVIQFFWVFHISKKIYDMKIKIASHMFMLGIISAASMLIGMTSWSERLIIDTLLRIGLLLGTLLIIYCLLPNFRESLQSFLRLSR
jgi:O-antigen/teichoic acid export membrane protein